MGERPELVVANRKHFYRWNGTLYPSVTGILKALPKPALIGWAAKATAEWAVSNRQQVYAVAETSPEAAVEMLKQARFKSLDAAGKLGSQAHAAILEGGQVTADIEPHVAQWETWSKSNGVVWVDREFNVVNEHVGYGGKVDSVVDFTAGELAGRRMLVDIKTGSGLYEDVQLQLVAYRRATVGLPDDIDGVAAVHLRPDFCKLVEYEDSDETFVTFRALRRVADWLGMLEPPETNIEETF